MDKKLFDSLDESLKEKLKNCKSDAEMKKIISDSGMQELSVDMLEGVSGGQCSFYQLLPQVTVTGNQKPIERN